MSYPLDEQYSKDKGIPAVFEKNSKLLQRVLYTKKAISMMVVIMTLLMKYIEWKAPCLFSKI